MRAKEVTYSEDYHADFADIVLLLADVADAATAVRFADALATEAANVRNTPEIGRVRVDLGHPEVRSIVVSGFRSYVLFYEYRDSGGSLCFVRVLHGARNLPTLLG